MEVGPFVQTLLGRARCNRNKGTDIATVSPVSKEICRLYNPRMDKWRHHFRIRGHHILGTTEVGKVTVILLDMNAPERLMERETLAAVGRYPSSMALKLIERPPF